MSQGTGRSKFQPRLCGRGFFVVARAERLSETSAAPAERDGFIKELRASGYPP